MSLLDGTSFLDGDNSNMYMDNLDMSNMDVNVADADMQLLNSSLSSDYSDPSVTMGLNPATISSPAANLSTNNMQGHIDPSAQMSNIVPMPSSASPQEVTPSPLSNSQNTTTFDAPPQADGVRTRSKTKPKMADIQPKPTPYAEPGSDSNTPDFEPETKTRATKAKKTSGRTKRNRGGKRNSLERNRIAASKCREKKKNWIHDLEETKGELEKKHRNLMSEYSGLVDELTELKNTLVVHANCHDSNIDGWINNEAAKYVNRVRRDTQVTTSASIEDQENSSLSTPSDANHPEFPLPDNSQDQGKMVDQFDQTYVNNDLTFNEDIFMMQPQMA